MKNKIAFGIGMIAVISFSFWACDPSKKTTAEKTADSTVVAKTDSVPPVAKDSLK